MDGIEKAFFGSKKESRLSPKIEELLNKQIDVEMNASQLYHAAAVWCEWKGFEGTAKFLIKHVSEERAHMKKLMEYMLDRDALPKIPSCKLQPTDFGNLKGVLQKALEHEIYVSGTYEKACAATENVDRITNEFLRFYLREQVEEEAIYLGLLDRLELIGADKKGEYFLDKEIGELV